MKEAGKQWSKQSFKIQTNRKKNTNSRHRLGFCSASLPNDSFYYQKNLHNIFQVRGELQESGPGAPLIVKENSMF